MAERILLVKQKQKMKQTLILILAALLSIGAVAQSDGIVMNMNLDASGNWLLTVQLNNPSTTYSAFQIDLQAPEGMVFDDTTLVAGERASNLTLATSTLTSGLQRVVGYAPRTASTISGSSGTLFTITLRAPIALSAGNYDIVAKNVRFSRTNGAETLLPGMIATFSVSDGDTYLLAWWSQGQIFRSMRLAVGDPIPAIDEPAAREGYMFSGWGDAPEVMPANDLNLEAQWLPRVYAITYMVDNQIVRVDSVAYGQSLSLYAYQPADTVHYLFSGWTGEELTTMPARDLTYVGSLLLMGDVNRDGIVNSSDVTAIYNYINSGEDSGISMQDADVDGNDEVNSTDVTALYNLISSNTPLTSPIYRRALIRAWQTVR